MPQINLGQYQQLRDFFETMPVHVAGFARRIGMNDTLLSQYITGKKIPSVKQLKRIEAGIHQLGRDLLQEVSVMTTNH
jgi:transcriptional regulator with XRE-family HTH domain